MNILFVCTGNTCRSPMAEGFLRKLALDNKKDIKTASAGLCVEDGEPASENAIEVSKEYGVDISGHIPQEIYTDLIDESDLILTMTKAHKQIIANFAPTKVYTLAEYCDESSDVVDPFGGDLDEYRACAIELYRLVEKLVEKL